MISKNRIQHPIQRHRRWAQSTKPPWVWPTNKLPARAHARLVYKFYSVFFSNTIQFGKYVFWRGCEYSFKHCVCCWKRGRTLNDSGVMRESQQILELIHCEVIESEVDENAGQKNANPSERVLFSRIKKTRTVFNDDGSERGTEEYFDFSL